METVRRTSEITRYDTLNKYVFIFIEAADDWTWNARVKICYQISEKRGIVPFDEPHLLERLPKKDVIVYCIVASCCTLQFIINIITMVLSASILQPKSLKHF
jgi:hypothetical protein